MSSRIIGMPEVENEPPQNRCIRATVATFVHQAILGHGFNYHLPQLAFNSIL